ncbi:mandelate racemase/muconate lactonizing enzyme family protein [uncultured Draconibacterium sp.]|uniref:mandelate racemase/muconate lactonizing enzyme family protein n=1 Tax=uncultured Draconibacterium sp. TaxID=1573823 RepID=UPI0025E2F313|nr:mandelate racemase/muconate lactonizing enzyme family protein [uncultured Draconibacterium sp.]
MKTNRRNFIAGAALAGAASILPSSCKTQNSWAGKITDYSLLDEALKLPVLKRELFSHPVIIESVELLLLKDNCLYRVRSTDGAEGLSAGHPFIAQVSYPMVPKVLARHFVGQDARHLDQLIFNAVEKNVKRQGIPLNVHVAGIEFAILDMLGNIADKPAGQLIGDVINPEIHIYLGHHLADFRQKEPEVSIELMHKDVVETQAKAIKLRAGTGDNLGLDRDNAPGRTEKLIRMAREFWGDEMVLAIDGNGSYGVKEAIRLGKILEEYNYDFWEEPVPWDWYEEQKQVERALDIKMAGGEEEIGVHAFRYLIGNQVFQILQPDLFYYGGMIRTMQVANMVKAAGLKITPHISRGGFGFLYMLHMVSVCPSIYKYHEFKMFQTPDANGNIIPIESKNGAFKCENGIIKAPLGAGLGIRIDPDYIKTHKVFKG